MPLQGDTAPAIPTYTNISPLGRGGSGLIYLSHHEGFDKPCVQKVVLMAGQPASIAFAEPRLMDTIRHDTIVRVLDTQPDPHHAGSIVFTMPYFKSGSVEFALGQGYRFSLLQAVKIACDLLSGLGHLHTEFGMVHRDVKPGNLLLSDNLQTGFLSDVGLAARLEGDGRAPGQVGTYIYMAPECFGPTGRAGVPGDLYGAALTLFELVNGPLPLTQIDMNEVMRRLGRGSRGLPDLWGGQKCVRFRRPQGEVGRCC